MMLFQTAHEDAPGSTNVRQRDRGQGQKGQHSASRQQAAPTIRQGTGQAADQAAAATGSRSSQHGGQFNLRAGQQQQRQDSDSMRAARNKAGQDMARRHDARSARARTHKEQRKREAMGTQRRAAQTTEGKKERLLRSPLWVVERQGVGGGGGWSRNGNRSPKML